MPEPDQFQLIRTIRGAPATILILLMLRGASMTNLEISRWTGYSDKPITTALITLQHLGLVQNNGRAHGWSLRAGAHQLPLMHVLEGSYPQPVEKEIGKIPIIGNIPISSLTTTTIENSSSSSGNSESSSSSSTEDRKNSDLVAHWLRRAGVGERSRKWRELMALNLDWQYVRAHALERLANPDRIWPGLLINRLLDGDPPPPEPRCPKCYTILNNYGWCPSYLCTYNGDDTGDGDDEEE